MKKVLGALAATLALCAAMATPAIADDQELNNLNNVGDTEVDAQILDAAGEVAYIVTVPEKIDFGKLICPDTADEPSYTTQRFTVTCVQKQGVNTIMVSVYNEGSTAGEINQEFFLTNKTNLQCGFKPTYEVYAQTVKIDTTQQMPKNGYEYMMLDTEGQSIPGGVRLDQAQLRSYLGADGDIASIAGEYTGTMVFTTAAI